MNIKYFTGNWQIVGYFTACFLGAVVHNIFHNEIITTVVTLVLIVAVYNAYNKIEDVSTRSNYE